MASQAEGLVWDAWRAVQEASDLITSSHPDLDAALQLLTPYKDIERFDGASQRTCDATRHLVCALMGDVLGARGDAEAAAEWYCLAAELPTHSGYAEQFAALVVDHRLSRFAPRALECLRLSNDRWRSEPWWYRAFGTVAFHVMYFSRPHVLREHRDLVRRIDSLEERLRTMVHPGGH